MPNLTSIYYGCLITDLILSPDILDHLFEPVQLGENLFTFLIGNVTFRSVVLAFRFNAFGLYKSVS